MRIRSLEFSDYKSFPKFSLSAKKNNILVGANNAGKSTTLDALRIVFDIVRYARRRSSQLKSQGDHGVCATYSIPTSQINVDLRHCVHNFQETSAKIDVALENGSRLVVELEPNTPIECYLVSDLRARKDARHFNNAFPIDLNIVPTLSPLEQNEEVVQLETVEKNRYGRLSSRNFRNFWLTRTNDEFENFADAVEIGWPGIRIKRPEIDPKDPKYVRMYFRDGANVREVQWAGFGFQVWMQTMSHLMQANESSILVLDEPDIYLHPDLQHKLLQIVSSRVGQFFIATHSTEIINAADPGDVLIIRPSSRSAKRIKSESNYNDIYSAIGSSENSQFARLAKTRKVLYFEGNDNRIFSRVSKKLSGLDFSSGNSVTLMKTDGFSNWSRVSHTAWVFKEFFEIDVKVAAVFDRDFRPNSEVESFEKSMKGSSVECFVLPCKEIENILLVRRAIKSVVLKYSGEKTAEELVSIDSIFDAEILRLKDELFTQKLAAEMAYSLQENPKRDIPSLTLSIRTAFEESWLNEDWRIANVPGKRVFASISGAIKETTGVTLTSARVLDEILPGEFNPGVLDIVTKLNIYFTS